MLVLRVIATFGFYFCLRKKQFGGIQVTSRRVLYISGTKAAAGEIVEFQQVSYFVRPLSLPPSLPPPLSLSLDLPSSVQFSLPQIQALTSSCHACSAHNCKIDSPLCL